MKKNLSTVGKLMMFCFIMVLVSSCGNVSKKLVGSWETSETTGGANVQIIRDMKEDGTFIDKMVTDMSQVESGVEMHMNLVFTIEGRWDATSKFYAIEYNSESANVETFEVSFPSATEEEKAALEEVLEIMTEYFKTEGMKEMLSELPQGRQQYINLKVEEGKFSYLTEDGEESWTKN